jgi:hypothetical protein
LNERLFRKLLCCVPGNVLETENSSQVGNSKFRAN